jgi:hypothetical protein
MNCTDTEMLLLTNHLRKAREEVVRAKMMLQAVADDGEDVASVQDLADMVDCLAAQIDSIVKADIVVDEDEDAGS